jgi:hypothetical protein
MLVILLVMAAGMIADWWFELSRWSRAGLLIANGLAASWILWTRLVQPLLRVPARDDLALFVERGRPELRSRLISALQLGRTELDTPEAAAFVRRLIDDANRATATLDPADLAPAGALRRTALRILPPVALVFILFAAAWPLSGILLRRAFLDEIAVPRKTRLLEVTGARTLGRGDDLTISATVEGVIPRSGRLSIRHASGRTQTLSMEPDPGQRRRFERRLSNLPASFEYRVRINDAESPVFRVEVLPRPAVTNLVITQVLPEYTHRAPRQLAPGELVLLRGSRLILNGAATQPLQRVQVQLEGLDRSLEAAIDPAEPTRFEAALEINDPRLNSFTIELLDQRDIGSRESAVYAVQVVPDRPPRARMILPARREELSTARSLVLVSFEATDDFGLAALTLRHQPAGETNSTAAIELDLEADRPAVARRRFEWDISALSPPPREGDLIEFWIEAADANDQEGPGVGSSDHYLIRVVSEAEKRADLLSRASDAIGRLGDVAEGQERLNAALGRIILARPPGRQATP